MTLIGFLAGYRGYTRDDMHWICASSPPGAGSTTIACSRSAGSTSSASPATSRTAARPRATVARRLCTIVGFYRYAEEEGVIEHSPAVHIRRPRIDYESHVAHLDRNELGAILVTAGLSSPGTTPWCRCWR